MTTALQSRLTAATTGEQFTPGLGIDIWSQTAIGDAETILRVVDQYPLTAPDAVQALGRLKDGAACLRTFRSRHLAAQSPVGAAILPDQVFTAVVRQDIANVRTAVSHLLGVPAFLGALDGTGQTTLQHMLDATTRLPRHL